MKTLWLGLALSILALADREGNFRIRFEPTAILQTGVQVPFEIKVTNDLQQPLHQAKVTLQIETKDRREVQIFKAPETTEGVYLSKPVFPHAGEWSVYVEVRRNDQVSARTLEYSVAKSQ